MSNFGFVSKKKVAKYIAEIIHAHPNADDFDFGACSALNTLCDYLEIKPMHRNKLGGGTGEMLREGEVDVKHD